MSDLDELAEKLDQYGYTLTKAIDPVDGEEILVLGWVQIKWLVNDHEGQVKAIQADLDTVNLWTAGLRAANIDHGAALSMVWRRVMGSEQPETASPVSMATQIVQRLDDATDDIEVTDLMVESMGNQIYGAAVVWDREKVRAGLTSALQAR